MPNNKITYRKLRKYKYQLLTDFDITIDIYKDAKNKFIELSSDGNLLIKENYAWDGPSGPTIDTKSFMRASLVHDALYQLIRNGKLNSKSDRKSADKAFKRLCKEDNMWSIRASYSYWAVRWFGAYASKPDNTERVVHTAP